jgi:hypothetical protein
MRLRRPPAVLAAFVALLAACSAPGSPPDSGVDGHAWVGPMCPVVQEGVDCPDRPLEAALEVLDSSGRVAGRQRSMEDGSFRFALSPGDYLLTVARPDEAGLLFAAPIPFQVEAGTWSSLDARFDSGIR